ncbi:MAG: hypothetical protein ACREH5_03990, partial [Candidatus Omnitrophota bacterium]
SEEESPFFEDGIIARLDRTKIDNKSLEELGNILRRLTGNNSLRLTIKHIDASISFDQANLSLYNELAIKVFRAILNEFIRRYKLMLDSTDWTA